MDFASEHDKERESPCCTFGPGSHSAYSADPESRRCSCLSISRTKWTSLLGLFQVQGTAWIVGGCERFHSSRSASNGGNANGQSGRCAPRDRATAESHHRYAWRRSG